MFNKFTAFSQCCFPGMQAMIPCRGCYAVHGVVKESIQHFEQMCEVILHQSIHWALLVCHTCLEIHASQMSLLETAAFKISSAHLGTGMYLQFPPTCHTKLQRNFHRNNFEGNMTRSAVISLRERIVPHKVSDPSPSSSQENRSDKACHDCLLNPSAPNNGFVR